MNKIFTTIDWWVIGIKIIALLALLFFSQRSFKDMLRGIPSKNSLEHLEYSLLILTLVAVNFHLIGRFAADFIINLNIDKLEKRAIYYAFFVIHEVIVIGLLLYLHKIGRCNISRICWVSIIMSFALIICQIARYVDRVIYETNVLNSIYSIAVSTINFVVVGLIAIYPLYRLLLLNSVVQKEK